MSKKVEIPMMIVTSKMKAYAAALGVRTSSEFVSELNTQVAQLINSAARRCEGNNRLTLKPNDL